MFHVYAEPGPGVPASLLNSTRSNRHRRLARSHACCSLQTWMTRNQPDLVLLLPGKLKVRTFPEGLDQIGHSYSRRAGNSACKPAPCLINSLLPASVRASAAANRHHKSGPHKEPLGCDLITLRPSPMTSSLNFDRRLRRRLYVSDTRNTLLRFTPAFPLPFESPSPLQERRPDRF